MKSPKKLLFTVFAAVGSLFLLFAIAEAATKRVSCNSSRTLNSAIASLKPGDTLLVSGTCDENVVIGSELSRITLDGRGTASINGPNPAANTIVVRGRNITIRGFTITGGSRGIQVSRGAEATLDGNIIESGRAGYPTLQWVWRENLKQYNSK